MTRPSYDPMRAPAPRFPRARFARIHDEETVAALAEAYEALTYEERVRYAHRVASAPDERLREIADELAVADQETPPAEPLPAGDPQAPAVNQAAAQVNPDAAPPPPGTPADGVEPAAPAPDTPDAATTAGEPANPAEPPAATDAGPDSSPAEGIAAGEPAPTPPPLPVPADQLPQLKVPELQAVAEQVGVAKSGTKAELVDRITAATGEQAAITPEQAAADAANVTESAPDAPAQPETPATATGAADGPQVAPATPGDTAGTPTTDGATP